MKNTLMVMLMFISSSLILNADNNESLQVEEDSSSEKTTRAEKQLEKQMKREEKFAQEQRFYHGKNHDLSYAEVNEESIDSVPLIEPEYDFDMDDVYD
jgi:hypothetical protein